MKAVTTYVTSDGKRFTDAEKAAEHERSAGLVEAVKAMLAAKGQVKEGTSRSGKPITRYIGLKKTLSVIADWEELKKASADVESGADSAP